MNDSTQVYKANITKYFIYQALAALGFGLFTAIWIIYLQRARGLSLAEAALVDSMFYVVVILGEVPTGIVADRYGRKISILIGITLMTVGALAWAFVPTLPLIVIAYALLGIGMTFTSGATDAFFYESVQLAGRGDDFMRLAGRSAAIMPAGLAVGSVIGGVLAELDLVLPYIASPFVLLMAVVVAITFKEPPRAAPAEGEAHKSFVTILRDSLGLMRRNPALRYPMIYLAFVPMASFMVEVIFLQPQAVKLGVPLAGIGLLYTGVQIVNIVGSTSSERIKAWFGEARIFYIAPVITVVCLIVLASLQVLPALVLIAVMSFLTAMMRPILATRIQGEVSDDLRATVLSMGSLMFMVAGIISQPTMGYVADRFGLPTTYLILAGATMLIAGSLLWVGRHHFPHKEEAAVADQGLNVEIEPVA